MHNRMAVHWIPGHVDQNRDRAQFQEWGAWTVKVVWTGYDKPPYTDCVPPGALYLYRNVLKGGGGFDLRNDPEAIGRQHADECKVSSDWLTAHGIPVERQLFEGTLNEPEVWDIYQAPPLIARCDLAFLKRMHEYGLHSALFNIGVGWPNNSGPDTPVDWRFYYPVFDEMGIGDFLCMHEYWADEGPEENWKWWAGRCLQVPRQIPMLITECGVDARVKYGNMQWTGWIGIDTGPWHGLNMDQRATRYVDELWRYMNMLDGRVQAVMPFTYDYQSNEWETFNICDAVFRDAVRRKVQTEPIPQVAEWDWGNPPPPPGETRKGIDISYWQRSGINWDAFKAEGNTFVMVRLSNALSLDSAAYGHIDQARYRGIDTGVYHYLVKQYDGQRQARLFASLSDNLDLQLPCAVDVEDNSLNGQGAFVKAFVDEWRKRTARPLAIYTSASAWSRIVGPGATWAADCPLWVAHWNVDEPTLPDIWQDWWMWQYAVTTGPEYPGPLDRDKMKAGDEPPPPPDETFSVSYLPGLPLVVGNYPKVRVELELWDTTSEVAATTSGTKPEWGPGGFEMYALSQTGAYSIRGEGKSWDVQMQPGKTAVCSWS